MKTTEEFPPTAKSVADKSPGKIPESTNRCNSASASSTTSLKDFAEPESSGNCGAMTENE